MLKQIAYSGGDFVHDLKWACWRICSRWHLPYRHTLWVADASSCPEQVQCALRDWSLITGKGGGL